MMERKPQDQDKFIVRLPDGMRDRIKAAADANNRSMNAEIVARLSDSFLVDHADQRDEIHRATVEVVRDLLRKAGIKDIE